jgi:hypothetical protein
MARPKRSTTPETRTSDTLKRAVKPVDGESSSELYARLGFGPSRSHELMRGEDPGTTKCLAIVGVRALVPASRGSERSAAMKMWRILRELHPEIFAELDHANSSAAA